MEVLRCPNPTKANLTIQARESLVNPMTPAVATTQENLTTLEKGNRARTRVPARRIRRSLLVTARSDKP